MRPRCVGQVSLYIFARNPGFAGRHGSRRRTAAQQQFEESGKGDVQGLAQAKAVQRLETASSKWYGYYICALLFGGAAGGLVFGRIGDRFGRVKGMTAAICCYSGVSFVAYFARTPEQLLVAQVIQ